jgi:hypothetical protein
VAAGLSSLLSGGVDPGRVDWVRQWGDDLDMLARLTDARLLATAPTGGLFDTRLTIQEFARAFSQYGIDVERLSPDQAAELTPNFSDSLC